MQYSSSYSSHLGKITLASDGEQLIGLWFDGQRYDRASLREDVVDEDRPVFRVTRHWLDVYFSGRNPGFRPPLQIAGSDFQRLVFCIMQTIPFGQTMTYGAIAREAAVRLGKDKMSAQAVGGAVAHNPISLLVPCHRVVGQNGSLTGYAGGLQCKEALLRLEHAELPVLRHSVQPSWY